MILLDRRVLQKNIWEQAYLDDVFCILYIFQWFCVTCTFISADAQIASPAQKCSLSNNCRLSMVPTSQLFEITVLEDGVRDLPEKVCQSCWLEIGADSGQIGRWSCLAFVLVQIIQPWLLAAGTCTTRINACAVILLWFFYGSFIPMSS